MSIAPQLRRRFDRDRQVMLMAIFGETLTNPRPELRSPVLSCNDLHNLFVVLRIREVIYLHSPVYGQMCCYNL